MGRPKLSRRTVLRGAALGSSVALAVPAPKASLGSREAETAA